MRYLGEGGWMFPDRGNKKEIDEWEPAVRRHELGRCVIAVARTRIEGAWGAYIDAVPGQNHDHEQAEVLRQGAKLQEHIARALFPGFEGVPYAR